VTSFLANDFNNIPEQNTATVSIGFPLNNTAVRTATRPHLDICIEIALAVAEAYKNVVVW
jgi:hypothetical protein